jgi:Zn-dependent protease
MAMAGPAANLALLIASALLIRMGMEWGVFDAPRTISGFTVTKAIEGRGWEFAAQFLSIAFSLNLLLFSFNLLPLPPFDGSAIPFFFLSGSAAEKYRELLALPATRIIGMIVAFQGFGLIYPSIRIVALNLLYPELHYS